MENPFPKTFESWKDFNKFLEELQGEVNGKLGKEKRIFTDLGWNYFKGMETKTSRGKFFYFKESIGNLVELSDYMERALKKLLED